MHIEAIAKKPPTDNQINWVTAFFMASFHIGSYRRDCRAIFLDLESSVDRRFALVDFGKPGDRHGLSPPTHTSRVQDSEMGRVFSDHLRYADARRWADFLGGYSPHSPSVHGPGRRSAFTA